MTTLAAVASPPPSPHTLDVRLLHLLQGAHLIVQNVLVQTLRRVLVLLRPILVRVKVVVVQIVLLRTAVWLQIIHRVIRGTVIVVIRVIIDIQRHQL